MNKGTRTALVISILISMFFMMVFESENYGMDFGEFLISIVPAALVMGYWFIDTAKKSQ